MGSSFAIWKSCSEQPSMMSQSDFLKNAGRWGGSDHCHAATTAQRFCPSSGMWRRPICGAGAGNIPVDGIIEHLTPHIPARLIGPRHQRRRIDHARRTVREAGYCRSLSGWTGCRGPRALPAAGKRRRAFPLDAEADRLGAALRGGGGSEPWRKHQLHTAEEPALPTHPAAQWGCSLTDMWRRTSQFHRAPRWNRLCATYWSAPHTATYVVHHICSGSEPVKPRNASPAWNGLRECRECRAVGQSAKAMSASKFWNISVSESPGSERTACQEGMCSESSEPLAGRLGAPAQRRHRV